MATSPKTGKPYRLHTDAQRLATTVNWLLFQVRAAECNLGVQMYRIAVEKHRCPLDYQQKIKLERIQESLVTVKGELEALRRHIVHYNEYQKLK